jgi:hypothetical protein
MCRKTTHRERICRTAGFVTDLRVTPPPPWNRRKNSIFTRTALIREEIPQNSHGPGGFGTRRPGVVK